jgi:glutamine phosphoribosylpyrophosphate amidotransferase
VKAVREKLANVMATKEAPDIVSSAPVVVGVPETGITLGQAYARTLGLEYAQLISTAPKATRTFIAKTSQDRRKACLDKFVYNEPELCGRDVVIVDDRIGNNRTIERNRREKDTC